MGIIWPKLMPLIFELIENGVIKKMKRTIGKQKIEIESVDLSDFNEIEVSLRNKSYKFYSLKYLTKIRRYSRL